MEHNWTTPGSVSFRTEDSRGSEGRHFAERRGKWSRVTSLDGGGYMATALKRQSFCTSPNASSAAVSATNPSCAAAWDSADCPSLVTPSPAICATPSHANPVSRPPPAPRRKVLSQLFRSPFLSSFDFGLLRNEPTACRFCVPERTCVSGQRPHFYLDGDRRTQLRCRGDRRFQARSGD